MSNTPKAMILAAGRGERLRPLTDQTPKPLISINGKPLIVYLIEKLAKAGIKDIVINISHLASQFPEKLGDGSQFGVSIHYSYEPEALDSGGGIFQALPLLGNDPFLLISGDIYTDYPFEKLLTEIQTPKNLIVSPWKTKEKLAHLILAPNPDFHPKGDYSLTKEGFLHEKPEFTYASFGILHPHLFEGSKPGKFSYISLINQLISQNLVTGEFYKEVWFNIGDEKQLKTIVEYLQSS